MLRSGGRGGVLLGDASWAGVRSSRLSKSMLKGSGC